MRSSFGPFGKYSLEVYKKDSIFIKPVGLRASLIQAFRSLFRGAIFGCPDQRCPTRVAEKEERQNFKDFLVRD